MIVLVKETEAYSSLSWAEFRLGLRSNLQDTINKKDMHLIWQSKILLMSASIEMNICGALACYHIFKYLKSDWVSFKTTSYF